MTSSDWTVARSRCAGPRVLGRSRAASASSRGRGVGYDTVDIAAATRKGVAVTVAAGTNDQSVADFTMGLLLLATRGIMPAAAERARQRGWERVTGTEAWRKTLAIVGLGRIGKAVAKRARGFDMRVAGGEPQPGRSDFARAHGVEFVTLDEALREADFVSLHAPLTPQTENLINARTLATMKRGAYLINTSRGGLVDEHALADAVRGGHLAGAAVDVLRVQGANSPSPLIGVPGIIVTPHMATFSRESMERVAMAAAGSVDRGAARRASPASSIPRSTRPTSHQELIMAITYEPSRQSPSQLYDRSLRGIPEDTKAALRSGRRARKRNETARHTLRIMLQECRRGRDATQHFVCSDAGVPVFFVQVGTQAQLRAATCARRSPTASPSWSAPSSRRCCRT